jgi:probable phosphoglycerate mutase
VSSSRRAEQHQLKIEAATGYMSYTDERATATTVLLIRHAHTDAVDRTICGRAAGILLSAEGRAQAERLGRLLSDTTLGAVYASPLERARLTADAIREHQQSIRVHPDEALNEIDYGAWTGSRFDQLQNDRAWQLFNRARCDACPPGGEPIRHAQHRIVTAVARLASQHRGQTIALVTHAELVRSALLHYRRQSLDDYAAIAIDPASVTAVRLNGSGVDVLYVNVTAG